MPFIPVPDAVEVRMRFTLGNAEEAINVFHYHNLTPVEITATLSSALAFEIEAAWETHLAPVIAAECVLADITVKDISAPDLPAFIWEQGVPGGSALQMLPYAVALCTTFRTQNGSRGGRGRKFMTGYDEAQSVGGDLAAGGARVATNQFWNAIQHLNDVDSDPDADFNLGVVSRHAHVGGDPTAAPIAPVIRDVVALDTNLRWDSQRRRSNKVRS